MSTVERENVKKAVKLISKLKIPPLHLCNMIITVDLILKEKSCFNPFQVDMVKQPLSTTQSALRPFAIAIILKLFIRQRNC